jgi:hypothetical protein
VTAHLPEGFENLEPFIDWALPSETERTWKRKSSPDMREIQAFWDTMIPCLPSVLEYLDRYTEDELSEEGRRLLYLALSTMEIAPAVENYGEPNVPLSADFRRWQVAQ